MTSKTTSARKQSQHSKVMALTELLFKSKNKLSRSIPVASRLIEHLATSKILFSKPAIKKKSGL